MQPDYRLLFKLSVFCCKFYCSFSEKLTKIIKSGIYRVFQTSRKMNICIAEKTVKSLVVAKKNCDFSRAVTFGRKDRLTFKHNELCGLATASN